VQSFACEAAAELAAEPIDGTDADDDCLVHDGLLSAVPLPHL
jgi:hypothetical protein